MGKRCLLILLVIGLVLTAGCWNRMELNELAVVLGVGVDLGRDGQVKMTMQIVKPGGMAGGGEKGGGSSGEPVLVLTTEGKTIFDAVRNFIAITSRKLFVGHNQVVIYGENIARKGLGPFIDFRQRDPEARKEVPILIAKGEAENILRLPGSLEKISVLDISDALKAASSLSKAVEVPFLDFAKRYHSKITAPIAPRIEVVSMSGKQTFRIAGMAVFKKDKLAGWLDEQETRGLLWILGKVKSGIIVFAGPDHQPGQIAMEIINVKSKIKADFTAGKPVISVQVEEAGNIGEVTGPIDISKPEIIRELEKKQGEAIKEEIRAALQRAQHELKADIFGFGEELRRANPKMWAKIKTGWEEEFSRLEVKIAVKTKVRRPGDKIKPSVLK